MLFVSWFEGVPGNTRNKQKERQEDQGAVREASVGTPTSLTSSWSSCLVALHLALPWAPKLLEEVFEGVPGFGEFLRKPEKKQRFWPTPTVYAACFSI